MYDTFTKPFLSFMVEIRLCDSYLSAELYSVFFIGHSNLVQYTLDLRKPDSRKNLYLRKIVGATDFLVHKLFDLRKIF